MCRAPRAIRNVNSVTIFPFDQIFKNNFGCRVRTALGTVIVQQREQLHTCTHVPVIPKIIQRN